MNYSNLPSFHSITHRSTELRMDRSTSQAGEFTPMTSGARKLRMPLGILCDNIVPTYKLMSPQLCFLFDHPHEVIRYVYRKATLRCMLLWPNLINSNDSPAYPPVVKHSWLMLAGKGTIAQWFSQPKTSMDRWFSSQPCLMKPEGNPYHPPVFLFIKILYQYFFIFYPYHPSISI